LLQCKAWDVFVNRAIGERRCNFGKIGQWGGSVQHVHRIGGGVGGEQYGTKISWKHDF
jgi:hypothetical protein